ncbi:hypothetical protein MNBD_GAMMA08-2087 [hydrothermal vent metagenome]|uniref:Uncharacterized protein n=1 Tax=hydrothermal vent metagenome TaxID=652676 RepID=A0A3B0YF77_9ZZZZ
MSTRKNKTIKLIMLWAVFCTAFMPLIAYPANLSANADSFIEPPSGLPSGRNENPTFSAKNLIKNSLTGMLDKSCGGYCVTGACAHFKTTVRCSISRGCYLYFYTIISPKIKHALPDFLVSSYNHAGDEPFFEWRQTFGLAVSAANNAIGPIIGSPFGLAGGRADPVEQDTHQSTSFKEVDIIGHPLTILPAIINADGSIKDNFNSDFKVPAVTDVVERFENAGVTDTGDEGGLFDNIDFQKMMDSTWTRILKAVEAEVRAALVALEAVQVITEIYGMIQYIKSIAELLEAISMLTEVSVRSSFYANFINPQFKMPRLFCPSTVTPLQPYYLSFADSFWWRAGYPLTDGPLSGSDHSTEILNPVGRDTLPTDADPYNPLDELWGNMYPREGTVNSNHDAKVAAVAAWRAMDVLLNDVNNGNRIGVSVPRKHTSVENIGEPKWQLIYPEVKSCTTTPYYPPKNEALGEDFIQPSGFGGYAWNYYRTYSCCSNTSGRRIGTITFPIEICLSLDEIEESVQQDREESEE